MSGASNFADQVDADLRQLAGTLGEFGCEVTYTPAGLDPVTIRGVLSPERSSHDLMDDREAAIGERTLTLRTDGDYGIPVPLVGMALTIDSVAYGVVEIESVGSGYAALRISRIRRTRRAGPDSRIEVP